MGNTLNGRDTTNAGGGSSDPRNIGLVGWKVPDKELGSEEAIGSSGSRTQASTSEAEAWPPGPWGTSSNRSNTGSTSPTRTRDIAPISGDFNNSYYTATPSTIGQSLGSSMSSRPRPNTSADHIGGISSFEYKMGDVPETIRNGEPSLSQFERNSRRSFTASLNGQAGDFTLPTTSQAEQPQPRNSFGNGLVHRATTFGSYASASGHVPRPSLQGANSFPSQTNNQLAYNRNSQIEGDMAGVLSRQVSDLAIDEPAPGTARGPASANAFSNPTQNMYLNAGSRMWNANGVGSTRPLGNGLTFSSDVSGESFVAPPFAASQRSSIVERNSTPGSAVPPTSSPTGPWSRPNSRGVRQSEPDLRNQNPLLLQQLYQQPQQQGLAFGQNYVNLGYQPQYPPAMYVQPYGASSRALPSAYPYNAFPLPHFGPSARTMTNQDPARDRRSVVLDDFRSSKNSRRWQLKVGVIPSV